MFRYKNIAFFLSLPLKSLDFMRMDMNVYNLFSKGHRLDLGVVSTGGARYVHGKSSSSWGNLEGLRRGRGGEPEMCLHNSQVIFSPKPSGGVTSPNP